MSRMWPWSSGAPVENEHTELEEQMSPDMQRESDAYDLMPGQHQASAAGEASQQQAGADSQQQVGQAR